MIDNLEIKIIEPLDSCYSKFARDMADQMAIRNEYSGMITEAPKLTIEPHNEWNIANPKYYLWTLCQSTDHKGENYIKGTSIGSIEIAKEIFSVLTIIRCEERQFAEPYTLSQVFGQIADEDFMDEPIFWSDGHHEYMYYVGAYGQGIQ